MTAGWYHVKIHVPGKGFAAHPDDASMIHAFESELGITSITPQVGGWAGGVAVTVHGAGFSTKLRNNTVAVEVGTETRPAHVLRADHEKLVIVMPSFEHEVNGSFFTTATGNRTATAGNNAGSARLLIGVKGRNSSCARR